MLCGSNPPDAYQDQNVAIDNLRQRRFDGTHPVRLAITHKYLNRLHVSERKLLNRMNQL
jgi:hypothetical protein